MTHNLMGDMLQYYWTINDDAGEQILDEEQAFLCCRSIIDMAVVKETTMLADGLYES